jgi:Fe-S cluster biogenesis protein NfuA
VNTADDKDFLRRMQRIELLIQELEHFPDPAAQALSREIVQALLELHGAGLAKILERTAQAGEGGAVLRQTFAEDSLIGSLLMLHGLHPDDLETRVGHALERVRPYLQSHGGTVELLAVAEGAVRLRMGGSCKGCPSSAQTIKQTIEEAIYAAAPDVSLIEIEQAEAQVSEQATTFIPVEQLLRAAPR